MTYDQLAEQIGLSSSAALRRVKRLEESAVIARYVALCAPSVGLRLRMHQRTHGKAQRQRETQPDGRIRGGGLTRGRRSWMRVAYW